MMNRRTVTTAFLGLLTSGCSAVRFNEALVEPYTIDLNRRRGGHHPPFAAVFQSRARLLAFVAAQHTRDPESATHRLVRQTFERHNFHAVIIEGYETRLGPTPERLRTLLRREPVAGDRGTGVGGEADLAARLALDAEVPFWGGEIEQSALNVNLMREGYTAEDILATLFVRELPHLLRQGAVSGPDDPRLDTYIERSVAYNGRSLADPPAFTPSMFRAWYQSTFDVALSLDPELERRNTPGVDTKCARIIQSMSHQRDLHLLRLIGDRLEADRRVFVVYGAGHFVTLGPALADALGAPSIERV